MRFHSLVLVLTAVARTAASDLSDHLNPLDRGDKKLERHRQLLAVKLGPTPFDCGRVMDSYRLGGPEVSISVYSRTQAGKRRYYVTCVQAERNLWDATDGMRHLDKALGVRVRRTDAEIPYSLAEDIKQAWLIMLKDVRPEPPLGLERVIVGRLLDFEIQRSASQPYLCGQLPTQPAGPKTSALVQIYESLWMYGKSSSMNRPAIEKKLGSQTKRLLARLRK